MLTCCSLALALLFPWLGVIMAQLPPKVPTITPNWADFPHQKMEGLSISNHHNHPMWVDEFLDFSSTRRGSHRRSMSDSIAFLEAPMAEECRRSSNSSAIDESAAAAAVDYHHRGGGGGGEGFEGFDDDQLMSMFNDDVAGASNPSSPSDHNSNNDGPSPQVHPKSEPEEDDGSCKSDGLNGLYATATDNSGERIADPKRIKRILANRQSAQRSRVRKLQYISELERSVTSLQAEVSVLSPRVAYLDHQRLVLNVDNSVLKQRIAALAQDKVFKDAHQEALKREIERLRQIYYQQNMKKMENGTVPNSPSRVADTNEQEQLTVN
ncbi:basic leucine zipper 61-like [Salvia miltiorrhiza]|uniref:basic leucine zipper 61-like n=1 Tax=Salvia miltiorrhiza TaxID=226208 RepID=UPI0025AD0027|nr:basic leucine zipper 61-like [Salvia miltiorrhiza]